MVQGGPENESYVGKSRPLLHTQYNIEDLPADDVKRIMANLPDDDSKPVDAFALSQNDIRRELVDRGIQPKGFFNDDVARLQEEYNREHVESRENRKKEIIQKAARDYVEQRDRVKRLDEETEIREEIEELAADDRLEYWANLIKANKTPDYAKLSLTNIGARALSKSIRYNVSLQVVDISNNRLDDSAGKHIAEMLQANKGLIKIDLAFNAFGPKTAAGIGAALTTNSSLRSLNLEDNPITDWGQDFSGIVALGNALTQNTSLTSLNLWHIHVGGEGGKALALGLSQNNTLMCLEFSCDMIPGTEESLIMEKIRENQQTFYENEKKQNRIKKAQRGAAERAREIKERELKRAETDAWLERRRSERQEQREREEEKRQCELKEEEERQRKEAERMEAERLAKEADKKKKGKGKKKGKK